MKKKHFKYLFIFIILYIATSSYLSTVFALTIDPVVISDKQATISWSGGGCGYDCYLIQEGAEFQHKAYCTSPMTYQNLAEGNYTFKIWEKLNPYSPVTQTFSIKYSKIGCFCLVDCQ